MIFKISFNLNHSWIPWCYGKKLYQNTPTAHWHSISNCLLKFFAGRMLSHAQPHLNCCWAANASCCTKSHSFATLTYIFIVSWYKILAINILLYKQNSLAGYYLLAPTRTNLWFFHYFTALPNLSFHTDSRSLLKPGRLKSMHTQALSQSFICQKCLSTDLCLAASISLFADSGPSANHIFPLETTMLVHRVQSTFALSHFMCKCSISKLTRAFIPWTSLK